MLTQRHRAKSISRANNNRAKFKRKRHINSNTSDTFNNTTPVALEHGTIYLPGTIGQSRQLVQGPPATTATTTTTYGSLRAKQQSSYLFQPVSPHIPAERSYQ